MGNCCSISIPCDAMATRCWDDCIRSRALYICKLEENLTALRIVFQELKEVRDDVVRKVNIAEQQQLVRLNQVQGWLSRVSAQEIEVDELIRDGPQEMERLCVGGCCSKNCKLSYKFGKRVAQKLVYVVALKRDGDFEEVAERVPASLGDVIPCDPAVGLESTFDKVWSCFQDEQVGIVGLYGIGGVGKTTLLIQINNKLLSTPDGFDVVIWVLVSKDLKVEKIQEDIGKRIGFSDERWNSKSHDKKAIDIFRVLSQKKFALLLDDIWERIDLTKVGIPHPNIQNGSKVVFTTRSEDVCYQMKVGKKIRVECLAWEKAWELFQEKVGEETLSIHPDIPKLAEIVAKECGGLPLALITIGRAMAGKRVPQQWNHAIEVLRRNASQFSGMEDKVFSILKYSYDNLHNEVKSCFLYCALFPEDFSINKARLIDYWIGEGFLDGYDDRREAENKGYDFIGTLLQACLLEDVVKMYEPDLGDVGDFVKMHDVIRDLALWIANECGKVKDNYLVETGAGSNEAPNVEKWNRARRVSLMANRIMILIEEPTCSNLMTLILCDNMLRMIGNKFFLFMTSLRVLDLSKNRFLTELPKGISKLVSLEHLNLSKTKIKELPDELKRLVKLKYLNLEHMGEFRRIPSQFISSFLKLEVLRIYNCDFSKQVVYEELECLKHLSTLTIDILSDSAFERFLSFQKLQTCIESLRLSFIRGFSLKQFNVSSLTNMKHLEVLMISMGGSFQELKIDWASEGREIQAQNDLHNSNILSNRCFGSLRQVHLLGCLELRDLTWLILAPMLTHLIVEHCEKMKEIISAGKLGEVPEVVRNLNPFAKLEVFILKNLPELESIYRSALPFLHLKKIDVHYCPKLKKLPLNSNSANECKFIRGEEHWWKELDWEDEATQQAFLPYFSEYVDYQNFG